jgi:hypothetical protein
MRSLPQAGERVISAVVVGAARGFLCPLEVGERVVGLHGVLSGVPEMGEWIE